MDFRPIAFLLALALAFGGMAAAPALAHPDEDADEPDHGEGAAKSAYRAEKASARAEYHERKADLRGDNGSTTPELAQAHAQCIRDVLDATNDTVDREAIKDCHERFKEERKDAHELAKERFKAAKEAAKARYKDRLEAARATYLENRTHDDDDDDDDDGRHCAESQTCIDRHVARLEAKLARAENTSLHLETKLQRLNAELAHLRADNNSTDEQIFRVQDAIMGTQIQLLEVDRAMFRLQAQLGHWQGLQDGTIEAASAETVSDEEGEVEEIEDEAEDEEEEDEGEA